MARRRDAADGDEVAERSGWKAVVVLDRNRRSGCAADRLRWRRYSEALDDRGGAAGNDVQTAAGRGVGERDGGPRFSNAEVHRADVRGVAADFDGPSTAIAIHRQISSCRYHERRASAGGRGRYLPSVLARFECTDIAVIAVKEGHCGCLAVEVKCAFCQGERCPRRRLRIGVRQYQRAAYGIKFYFRRECFSRRRYCLRGAAYKCERPNPTVRCVGIQRYVPVERWGRRTCNDVGLVRPRGNNARQPERPIDRQRLPVGRERIGVQLRRILRQREVIRSRRTAARQRPHRAVPVRGVADVELIRGRGEGNTAVAGGIAEARTGEGCGRSGSGDVCEVNIRQAHGGGGDRAGGADDGGFNQRAARGAKPSSRKSTCHHVVRVQRKRPRRAGHPG